MSLKSSFLKIQDRYFGLRTWGGILLVIALSYAVYRIAFTPGDLTWISGDTQTYTFTMRSSVRTFNSSTGITGSSVSEIRGKLGLRIYEVKDGTVKAGFHLESDTATVNDQPVERIRKLYSYPFYVTFSTTGEPLRIYASRDVSRDDEKFIKGLIYYLQYVYPSPAANWTVNENDGNGKYLSSYSTGKKGVSKTRKVSPLNRPSEDLNGKSSVKSSSFNYIFDENWSWISGLKAKERWTTLRSDISISSTIEIELTADKKGLNETSALARADSNYEIIVAELDDPVKKIDSIWEEMRLEKAAEKIKDDSHLEFISLFNKNILSSADFINRMTDYLKIHKSGAFKLSALIIDRNVNDKTGDLIMYSMGNAGTLECQKALFSLASETRLSSGNRTRAAVYLGDLKTPDISTIHAMESFYSDYSDKNTAILSSALVCSLGRISSVMKSEGTLSRDINDHLRQKLNSGNISMSERCALLNAAANTGDSSFIPEINRDLANNDSFVRSTAVSALANMQGEEADGAIRNTMKNDLDPMVRKQAVRVQEQREYNEQFTKELISFYDSEKEGEVRLAMVKYLRSVKGSNPDVTSFMQSALKNEKDPEVRVMLLKAINTSR